MLIPLYRIIYSNGAYGSPMTWSGTLDLVRFCYRRRDMVPVRVELV